jgi:hypothetical protein
MLLKVKPIYLSKVLKTSIVIRGIITLEVAKLMSNIKGLNDILKGLRGY